jgi:hypothetical protein
LVLWYGIGMADLPLSKLRRFLLTAGNPLEPEVFVRAGGNEVDGRTRYHDQTDKRETLERYHYTNGYLTKYRERFPGQESKHRE